jgi:ABC-type antimicrobial peptide transport system permease subunit
MVLLQNLAPVCLGLAAGIAASLAFGRLMGSLLFGVSAGDPVTLASVIALLMAVGAAATYFPSLRLTRIDPSTALRYE